MTRHGKVFLYGLLLCAAALTSFASWGIWSGVHLAQREADKLNASVSDERTQLNGTISRTAESITTNVSGITAHVNGVLNQAGGSVRRVNASLDIVNRACVPGPCGTLADLAKTLNTARGTMGQIEVAANHEDKRLTVLDAQENQAADDLHKAIASATGTFTDLDALLKSPTVNQTADNVKGITGSLDAMLSTANALTQKETKSILHPSRNPWIRTGQMAKPWIPLGARVAVCLSTGVC